MKKSIETNLMLISIKIDCSVLVFCVQILDTQKRSHYISLLFIYCWIDFCLSLTLTSRIKAIFARKMQKMFL